MRHRPCTRSTSTPDIEAETADGRGHSQHPRLARTYGVLLHGIQHLHHGQQPSQRISGLVACSTAYKKKSSINKAGRDTPPPPPFSPAAPLHGKKKKIHRAMTPGMPSSSQARTKMLGTEYAIYFYVNSPFPVTRVRPNVTCPTRHAPYLTLGRASWRRIHPPQRRPSRRGSGRTWQRGADLIILNAPGGSDSQPRRSTAYIQVSSRSTTQYRVLVPVTSTSARRPTHTTSKLARSHASDG